MEIKTLRDISAVTITLVEILQFIVYFLYVQALFLKELRPLSVKMSVNCFGFFFKRNLQ